MFVFFAYCWIALLLSFSFILFVWSIKKFIEKPNEEYLTILMVIGSIYTIIAAIILACNHGIF